MVEGARARRVVVLDIYDDLTIETETLAPLGAEVVYVSPEAPEQEILTALADADSVLLGLYPLRAETIARLTRCVVIARYGIGTDNIDLEAARRAGIAVTNVPDFCLEEVGTHTLALALALIRKVVAGNDQVRAGGWDFAALGRIERLSQMRYGVVGYGRIGRLVAGAAKALGFAVAAADLHAAPNDGTPISDLDDLLAWADVISLHVPSTPETRGLIGRSQLARMKPGAYLVNTGRGPLVDGAALAEALRGGRIAGAALDVFETEPPPAEWIATTPNLIATPHMAFYSEAAAVEARTKASRQVALVFAGRPVDYPVVVP